MNINSLKERLNSNDSSELYDTIIDIGKGGHKQLLSEITSFLHHEDSEARRAAIIVLGTYWQIPEVIDKLENLWKKDPEELVRATALIAWSGYFINSGNSIAMNKLYQILVNDEEELLVMIEALVGIIKIAGSDLNKFDLQNVYRVNDFDEFKNRVPWDEIKKWIDTNK